MESLDGKKHDKEAIIQPLYILKFISYMREYWIFIID